MLSIALPAKDTFAQNRAKGGVNVDILAVHGTTRLQDLHEHGSLRLRFPNPDGKALSGVFINTAGGVAGGDVFSIDVKAQAGAQITLTTAAAEKIYRSHGPDAEIKVALRADDGATLSWIPQETIMFDQARVSRTIDIEIAESARLLLCEMVVFGRTAMGETFNEGRYLDRWQMRRGGKLVFAETLRLEEAIPDRLESKAIAGGGIGIGTALIVPGDDALADRIRALAPLPDCEFGVSSWNGFAMVRFCAQDASRLRAQMIAVLSQTDIAPLPRIWLQ